MLEELIIKDFALIDRLAVSFENGLNILTGETGAGKSIVVGSIGFLLGGKAEIDSIREGSDETIVSAVVRIDDDNEDALEWLKNKEIFPDNGRVLIRRSLKRTGRSVVFIQETTVSRVELVEFSGFLFDLHGQHEHQLLLKPESHRRYLDRFAGIEAEVQAFTVAFSDLSIKKKQLEESMASEKDRDQKIELLKFEIDEIAQANITPGETASLEDDAKKLASFEKLASIVTGLSESLFDDEKSALNLLRKIKSQIEVAKTIDSSIGPYSEKISDMYYELEDISDQIKSYRDDLEFDPTRLESIEERLTFLFKLKKKYGSSEEAIAEYRLTAQNELDALSRLGENRDALTKTISELEKTVSRQALELSDERKKASGILSLRITEILNTLGMRKASFSVSLNRKGDSSSGRICGPTGIDNVEFLIAPNQGEPMRELTRIASGGELSRVMLAIKTVLANADTVETLIFDEIDTGIGGEVALSVGEHLKGLGKSKQIFCITHLASIAVRADNHFKVIKIIDGGRTTTRIDPITGEKKRDEIARMLAGDSVGSAALAHADELISKYRGK